MTHNVGSPGRQIPVGGEKPIFNAHEHGIDDRKSLKLQHLTMT